ncbi:hypothetical protein DBB29_18390 [Pandoraea cepalis]|uniref:Uncharacterized protein n=1 Tax=Pandoraea cepalis TaxID=2508294 RepID=A0AAW7MP53_9BURK|nr:hypothetical protein [Pandoraea cepalis]MDN4580081.1 hypothetical protein [Pandoraea cepalis]
MLTPETGRAKAFALDDVLLAGLRATARKPGNFVIVGGLFALSGRCFLRVVYTPFIPFISVFTRRSVSFKARLACACKGASRP